MAADMHQKFITTVMEQKIMILREKAEEDSEENKKLMDQIREKDEQIAKLNAQLQGTITTKYCEVFDWVTSSWSASK